jgi:hypothetical protein
MSKEKIDKTAYKNQFIAANYDRINLTVPKGDKETIKAHADEFDGGSVNGFINRAIKEAMHRDRLHRNDEKEG